MAVAGALCAAEIDRLLRKQEKMLLFSRMFKQDTIDWYQQAKSLLVENERLKVESKALMNKPTDFPATRMLKVIVETSRYNPKTKCIYIDELELRQTREGDLAYEELVYGWKPIATAPRNATKVEVRMSDGTIYKDAHWACDLSGDEQPPFKGWFIPGGDGFIGIPEPEAWRLRK